MTDSIGIQTNVGRIPIGAAFTWRFPVTTDGTATGTPVNLTGRTYKLVVRRIVNGKIDQTSALLENTSPTFNNYAATADAADFSIASSDFANAPEGDVYYTFWRTDDPNDRPEAYGNAKLFRVAAQ